jgi:hypothetical protein
MKKYYVIIFVFAIVFVSCGQAPREAEEQAEEKDASVELRPEEQAFLDNLASLCGQSFRGVETYMQEGRESWSNLDFVMHVTVCEDDRVHIPFHLSDDTSRTWMFINEDGRLRFRHDHSYPDGTPHDQTLYGGYADGKGTAYAQYFPIDQYSKDLLEGDFGREWHVILDEDMTNFSYRLLYSGVIVFQADFDLTNPL